MHHFNWLTYLFPAHADFLHHHIHVIMALFILILLVLMSLKVKSNLSKVQQALVPSAKFGITNIMEVLVENILGLVEGIVGHGASKHVPILASIFIFVFASNLIGQIPGVAAPTSNFNTNLAIAACIFVYYNYVGIKEQGLVNYLKHFLGIVPSGKWYAVLGILPISLLVFGIEVLGNFIRVATLSIRLFININADHMVLGAFSHLVPIIVPIVFMIFGLFVSFVQAFVFTLLSSIYIGLASAHDDEGHH